MGTNRIAVWAVVVLSVIIVVPLLYINSNAVTDDEIQVNIDGNIINPMDIQYVTVNIQSGESAIVKIYITNWSSDPLFLKVVPIEYDTIDISTSLTIRVIGRSDDIPIISGVSDPESLDNIAEIIIAITADRYANCDEELVIFGFILTNMHDRAQSEPHIEFEIPVSLNIDSTFSSEKAYNKFFGIIPNTMRTPFSSPWFTAAFTMILWITGTVIASYVIIPFFTGMCVVKKTKNEKNTLRWSLTKTISTLMFVIAFNECTHIVGANAEAIYTVSAISSVFYVVIGAYIAWQVYNFIITAIIMSLDMGLDIDGIDSSLLPLFKMIGKIVTFVVAISLMLSTFGVDLAGIMVSAGVVTLGITLGAQNTLNQFFSGLVLLSTRPFKKGDYVRINNEVYIVARVRLMFTEFKNWDRDQIITIPNNIVSGATIVNLTHDSKITKIFVYMSIAYNSNLELAKDLMIKAAKMHPHVITDGSVPKPSTRLTNFQDSGIEYRLACFVDDFNSSSQYASQLREVIYHLFIDNEIEIPYNRLDVNMIHTYYGRKKDLDKDIK